MHENYGGVLRAIPWTDQSTSEPNVAVRKMHVFAALDIDAASGARRSSVALPDDRRNFARAIALETDLGFDRGPNRCTGASEEAVVSRRIQRPHLAGFVQRNELIRSAQLAPELEIEESTVLPLIGAGVLAKGPFVHRLHNRSLLPHEDVRASGSHDSDKRPRHSVRVEHGSREMGRAGSGFG